MRLISAPLASAMWAGRIFAPFARWRRVERGVLAKIAKGIQIACDRLADEGLTLALENARSLYANTGGNMRRVLDAVDRPALKIIWDPANALWRAKTGPALPSEGPYRGRPLQGRPCRRKHGVDRLGAHRHGGTDWDEQLIAGERTGGSLYH